MSEQSRYFIRRGREGEWMYYSPYNGHECWTDDFASVFRFDSEADAMEVASALALVNGGLAVETVNTDG